MAGVADNLAGVAPNEALFTSKIQKFNYLPKTPKTCPPGKRGKQVLGGRSKSKAELLMVPEVDPIVKTNILYP